MNLTEMFIVPDGLPVAVYDNLLELRMKNLISRLPDHATVIEPEVCTESINPAHTKVHPYTRDDIKVDCAKSDAKIYRGIPFRIHKKGTQYIVSVTCK
jgi:hypothetical protein